MKIIFLLLILTSAVSLLAQQNIADAKLYREGETISVSGIVTNGDELGPVRYIQDKTAGVAIYDSKLVNVKKGDSIFVTGEVHPYNNLFEITNISVIKILASNLEIPAPKIINIDDIGENYEGQLIQINKVKMVNPTGSFTGETNYKIISNGKTAEFRINKNATSIIGMTLPTGEFSIQAICSQYKDSYQLLPREFNDFISNDPINFTSALQVKNIKKSGFTLFWTTDTTATSEVIFGLNNDPTSWTNFAFGNSTSENGEYLHEVNIAGLDASTIIYAKAFSALNNDTAFSAVGAFATESNSSGKIKIYFNSSVDHSVSTGSFAENIGTTMEDTVIAYINKATEAIDFCIYNFNNSGLSNVSEALNNAKKRGVNIRVITSGNTSHSGADELDQDIWVLESPYNTESGIMHNKFIVFDANSTDPEKSWVWTGSTNLTEDQVNLDANNMILIQDQTLAKTYQIEFEEMWGSPGLIPNNNNSKFGVKKTDNTPHEFLIGGKKIQCYFSPSDGTNQQIINSINSADNDLEIETMLITRLDLANTIIAAKNRGVEVQMITDNRTDNLQIINDVLDAALPDGKFVFDVWIPGMLHHKLAIVDANFADSDPQVITGSHNWSFSADNLNDENTLIIHDAEIANLYFQQFAARFAENKGILYVNSEKIESGKVQVYPNPTSGKITVSSTFPIKTVQLYSVSGTKIKEIAEELFTNLELNLYKEKPGIYFLKVGLVSGEQNTYKIIKK